MDAGKRKFGIIEKLFDLLHYLLTSDSCSNECGFCVKEMIFCGRLLVWLPNNNHHHNLCCYYYLTFMQFVRRDDDD